MDEDKKKRLEKMFELDDLVPDGVYCVPPTEEDMKVFEAYLKKLREEQRRNNKPEHPEAPPVK